ncbi:MAG: FecCD family ABC transporter permease [Armatimonadota bacterium]
MSDRPLLTHRVWLVLTVLGALLVISMVLAIGVGSANLHPGEVMRAIWGHISGVHTVPTSIDSIVWELRMPRIVLAMLVGAALAVSGALMQSLFHNPMADPYIVGVSSGAAVGAVVAIILIPVQAVVLGLNLTVFCAFAGGVGVTFLVYTLARRGGRVPISTLLLTGIAVGGLMQAATSFLLLRQDHNEMRQVLVWLMGSLAERDWSHVLALLPYTVLGVIAAYAWQRDLNVLALGDETAHHLGINLERTKFILLLIASMLAAAAVAVSGIIAFVGLIVPHLMRLLVGPNHRVLIPACLLSGGLLVLWADVLARIAIPGAEIPIGVVTSMLGCIFFLYLLHRREGKIF